MSDESQQRTFRDGLRDGTRFGGLVLAIWLATFALATLVVMLL